MEATSFLYHDIVDTDAGDISGFSHPGTAKYKLRPTELKDHLRAVSQATKEKPVSIFEVLKGKTLCLPIMLTFDDGGISAYNCVAGILEELGWQAHFFITTNYIGKPSFVNVKQIRALREKGHIIGTHSHTHPERMSSLGWDKLVEEWRVSTERLADILGEKIEVGSVPGGYYSKRVAEAASACGLRALFTSEPVKTCSYHDGCLVLGRYTITKNMPSGISFALVKGRLLPRAQKFIVWNLKKIPKALGGKFYLKIRKFLVK